MTPLKNSCPVSPHYFNVAFFSSFHAFFNNALRYLLMVRCIFIYMENNSLWTTYRTYFFFAKNWEWYVSWIRTRLLYDASYLTYYNRRLTDATESTSYVATMLRLCSHLVAKDTYVSLFAQRLPYWGNLLIDRHIFKTRFSVVRIKLNDKNKSSSMHNLC